MQFQFNKLIWQPLVNISLSSLSGTASTFSPYGRRYFDPLYISDYNYRTYPYHYFR